MKITKSRLIQIIKEEISKEVVDKEKRAALKAMLGPNEDGRLDLSQLGFLFGDPELKNIKKLKNIKDEVENLKGEEYKKALLDRLDQEPAIDPEGNPLEFSS